MERLEKAALVLEGGSLRGLFTAGVLDTFLENEIYMSYVNGVSAGAMNGMNYISKQKGRAKRISLTYLHDRRYISKMTMFRERKIFNFDFLFNEISENIDVFDWKAFRESEQKFEVVATRCKNGRPEYFEKESCSSIVKAVEASASLPLLSKMVTVEGKKYLDGGVSMPIAYQRAFDLGYQKVVLVLTRDKEYRKKPLSNLSKKVYASYFGPLPNFVAALEEVPERYNRMQEEIERLEKEGKIFVIRPQEPVIVKRLEKNSQKLEDLYQQAVEYTNEILPRLREYLNS